MRLHTMYYLCKNNIGVLEKSACKQYNNSSTYRVHNWSELNATLETLYIISSLRNRIDSLYRLVPIQFRYSTIVDYDTNTCNIFNNELKLLILCTQNIINLYDSLGYEESENRLELRLPDNLGLDELSELSNDLNKVFTQSPFIERESGNARIIKSDVGSVWLILVGSAAFLTSVGYLVGVTTKAKADMVSVKQSEVILNEMSLKADVMTEVKKAHDVQKSIIMSKYIDELSEKTGRIIDGPEDKSRAELTLELLDKWMDKGLQIYAAIDTSHEIQVLFPEQPELKLLDKNAIKFIEDKARES